MNVITTQDNSMMVFDEKKLQLLKNTICRGSTDDEFELFVHACKRTGLDPFMRQIHAVKRWDSNLKKEVMSIQTGIDGYRLIAERTGCYVPGKETTYQYDAHGQLISATAYVKKLKAGEWHEIPATAHYCEYVALTKDKTPTHMWATKGHIMLGKCAEALALRKSFPADLSGIYTKEEMEHVNTISITAERQTPCSLEQVEGLCALIDNDQNPDELKDIILKRIGVSLIEEVPAARFEPLMKWGKDRQEKQRAALITQKAEGE